MQVRATAKYVRISPRQARLVANLIRGKPVSEAPRRLAFTPPRAARLFRKVVQSAVANAENNYNLAARGLVVLQALADPGPTLKRWRAQARGRVSPIKKRSSHLTVVVGEREERR